MLSSAKCREWLDPGHVGLMFGKTHNVDDISADIYHLIYAIHFKSSYS